MKVAELEPAMDAKVSFDPRFSVQVPDVPGCNILASIYDDVLYIGETNSLNRRMGEHLDDPRMNRRTYLGVASWFYFVKVPCDKTFPTEQSMLTQHKYQELRRPPLNRKGP